MEYFQLILSIYLGCGISNVVSHTSCHYTRPLKYITLIFTPYFSWLLCLTSLIWWDCNIEAAVFTCQLVPNHHQITWLWICCVHFQNMKIIHLPFSHYVSIYIPGCNSLKGGWSKQVIHTSMPTYTYFSHFTPRSLKEKSASLPNTAHQVSYANGAQGKDHIHSRLTLTMSYLADAHPPPCTWSHPRVTPDLQELPQKFIRSASFHMHSPLPFIHYQAQSSLLAPVEGHNAERNNSDFILWSNHFSVCFFFLALFSLISSIFSFLPPTILFFSFLCSCGLLYR